MASDEPAIPVTFIVKVTRQADGAVRGVVQRVRSGRTEGFVGLDGLPPAVDRMLSEDDEVKGA